MMTHMLDNGTQIVFQPQPGIKSAALFFKFKVGSVNEAPHLRGISHFIEHMLFKGTKRYPGNSLTRMIQSIGGELNGFTSFEITAFLAVVPKEKLNPELFDIWIDTLRYPLFEPIEFETEKKVVIEEIKMKLDIPQRRSWDLLRELVFTKHRYGIEIKGYEDTLRQQTPADMRGYYETYYQPNNMTVIILGDYTPDWVFRSCEAAIAQWKNPKPVQYDLPEQEPEQLEPRMRVVYSDVKHAYIHLGYHAPRIKDDSYMPLSIATQILSSGRASRLYKALVQTGLCTSAVCHMSIEGNDPGQLDCSITCEPQKIDEAMQAYARVINEFAEKGPTEEELIRTKNAIYRSHYQTQENIMNQGVNLAMHHNSDTLDLFDNYLEYVQKISADETKESIAQWIAPKKTNALFYLPESCKQDQTQKAYTSDMVFELFHSRKSPSLIVTGAPVIRKTVLDTGTTVILDTYKRMPVFALTILLNGGHFEETRVNAGLTSVLLNTLIRGLIDGNSTVSELLERLGSTISPFVDMDFCGFFITGLSRNFEETMRIIELFLKYRSIADQALFLEKQNTISLIKQEEDDLYGYTSRLFNEGFFKNHSYGLPLDGYIDSVSALTKVDLSGWIERMYHRERAIITFSGDYPHTTALAWAERFSGALDAPRLVPVCPIPFEFPTTFDTKEVIKNKKQANFILGFAAPAFPSEEAIGMRILSVSLSAMGHRFWTVMRDQKGLCYVAVATYMGAKTLGHMEIYVGTSPEREKEALDTVYELLSNYKQEAATHPENQNARQIITGSHNRSLERCINRCQRITFAAAYGLPNDYIETFTSKVNSFSIDRLQQLKQAVILPGSGYLVIVKPGA